MTAMTVTRKTSLVAPIRARSGARTAPAARIAADPTRTGIRLTGRGRVVLGGLGLALAIGAGSIAGQAAASLPGDEPVYETTIVTAGDTLWGIAAAVAEPGEDVRDLVAEISSINGLDSVNLAVGDELKLPS